MRRIQFYKNIERVNNPELIRRQILDNRHAALANSDPLGLARLGVATAEFDHAAKALETFQKPVNWTKIDSQQYSGLASKYSITLRQLEQARDLVKRIKAWNLKNMATPDLYVDRADDPAPFPITVEEGSDGIRVNRDTISVAKRVQNETLKRMRARRTIENHHVEAGEILMTLVEQSGLTGGSAWSDTSIHGTGGSRDIVPAAVEAVSELKRIRKFCNDSPTYNTMMLVIYHQSLADIAVEIYDNSRARAMADVSCIVKMGLEEAALACGLVSNTRYQRPKSIIRNYQNPDAGDGVEGDWAVSVDPAFCRRSSRKGGNND